MFNWKKVSLILLASAALLKAAVPRAISYPRTVERSKEMESRIQRSIKILLLTGKKYVLTWKSSI